MQFKITISIEVGDTLYTISDSQEVNTEEWDIEGVASEHLDCLTYRMKSALSPCFWDHEMLAAKKIAEEK